MKPKSVARALWTAALCGASLVEVGTARAQLSSAPSGDDRGWQSDAPLDTHSDTRNDLPIVAYAYSASGAPAKSLGLQVDALSLVASGQKTTWGGGGSIWGSPIDRLTLIIDAQRNLYGDFSPSFASVFRIVGDREDGWSFGALGKFRVEGFAAGPRRDEVESEIEVGALVSLARRGWYLDANGIAGRGTGDEGETDVEARLRLGRDLGRLLRVGIDAQARLRVAGLRYLANGRTWDFAAGPQALLVLGEFFVSLTTGPATMGLTSSHLGWTAVTAFGGRTP